MPSYILCPEYVNSACANWNDYLNVLLKFCQDNNLKVCFDSSDHIVTQYNNMVQDKDLLNQWLKFISSQVSNFETIDVAINNLEDHKAIALQLCAGSYDKRLSCNTKQDYLNYQQQIEDNRINLIDRDELRIELANNNNFINNQIIQTTHGSNSPNIAGNKNKNNSK